MITWTEIQALLRKLWRWSWVIILAVSLSGGTALLLSQYERRYYVARTTLMIGNSFEAQRPDVFSLEIGSTLGSFYGELARRERILKPVQENLQLPFEWNIIANEMLKTSVIGRANLLEIYITDTNPERAAAIANAVGQQLIDYSPTAPEKIEAEQRAIDQQILEANSRVAEIRARIAEATERQRRATSASDLAEANSQLAELERTLNAEQQSYNALLGLKNSSVVNSLTLFESADPPTVPLPSKRVTTVAIAMLAGLVLSVGAIFLLDRLDTRLRTPDDMQHRFSVIPLGLLPKGPPIQALLPPYSTTRHQAVRQIQTNVLLAAAERGVRLLMVTSPSSNEDRTALSIDLADLFARAGHRVLLVDADPTSASLTQRLNADDARQPWTQLGQRGQDRTWAYLMPTPLQNVALLPANPTLNGEPAMLSSLRWQEITRTLVDTADVVIFDGPPASHGPDAALLAPHVDGVILAVDPSSDTIDDVSKAKQRLEHQKGVTLLGAVTFEPSPTIDEHWRLPDRRMPELPDPAMHARHITDQQVEDAIISDDVVSVADEGPLITPPPTAAQHDNSANGNGTAPRGNRQRGLRGGRARRRRDDVRNSE
ncbi:MAG TPA: AAA family ATPase [Roseiflexaceae bacterium]|nr:AAA family ATPase [Roseiflexaceae bacterium]HMP40879.1 AAA family ATPase [Roseiflexaceae bacterium]